MFGLGNSAHSGSPSTSRANNNNNTRAQSKSSSDEGGIFIQKYLTNCKSFYSCIYCRTHLANHDELVSRSFQGNRSRAYLFNSVINISCGPSVQRALNTGAHAVADIFCTNCGKTMGWKYEKAYVESQKYKEGKYIIELAHVVRENRHLELDKRDMILNFQHQQPTMASSLSPANNPTQREGSWRYSSAQQTMNSCRGSRNNSNRWSTSSSNNTDQDNEVIINDIILNEYENYDDDDEDDDDLMFPIYDDLMHIDRSSCPSFSERSLYNNSQKYRRSIYLDSAPYDWKYSTSSPQRSDNPTLMQVSKPKASDSAAVSLASSASTPPSSTSSSSSASACSSSPSGSSCLAGDENSLSHDSIMRSSSSTINNNIIKGVHARSNQQHQDQQQNEPQFKFDFETEEGDNQIGNSCDQGNLLIANRSTRAAICDLSRDSTEQRELIIENEHQPAASTSSESNEQSLDSMNKNGGGICEQLSRTNSLSLDDEEFYDCCTDHDVSNSISLNQT